MAETRSELCTRKTFELFWEIEEKVKELNSMEQQFVNHCSSICDVLEPEDRERLIDFLYWSTTTKTMTIIQLIPSYEKKHHGHFLMPYVPAKRIGTCIHCQKAIEIQRRTQEKKYDKIEDENYVCPACEKAIQRQASEQSDLRWEEHKSERQNRLRELRSMPYSEYLQTPEWKSTRLRALKRARFRCQVCNASQCTLDVHHRTYERLGYEDNCDVTVLCRGCHEHHHLGERSE